MSEQLTVRQDHRKSSVLDKSITKSLQELITTKEPDFFDNIVDIFVISTAELIEELAKAVDGGDDALTRKISHRLGGSSINIGARALAEECWKLEAQSLAGAGENCRLLLRSIERAFLEVSRALYKETRQAANRR